MSMVSPTFFEIVHRVIFAILTSDVGQIIWPSSDPHQALAAQRFASRSTNGVLDKCVGAVDGLFICIKAPSRRDSPCVIRFYSGHKNAYGVKLRAACDADCRFIGAACNTPGSTNDAMAWQHCDMKAKTSRLTRGYHIVGDAAYTLTISLMTPYAGSPSKHSMIIC